jgi:tryptophanyl-tRNA synthetase
MKPTIFSGIQPTGNLHIGNYLGAVRNWVRLQDSGEYNTHFCIVDYHSLTGNRTAAERRNQIIHTAAELIAAGVNPEKSTFFVQSHVPAHTELGWIFNTITPMAELERMTQYKDKSARQADNINTGLFTYPVLQAADILLYHATHVPVGEDQVQHIELTRDIARWFNNKYETDYFRETTALLTEIPRVKSLLEPTAKMSKSKGDGHVIELCDTPEMIEKKLKKAVTATEGGGENPGVQNLLLLLKEFGDEAVYEQYVAREADGSIRYGDLKADLTSALSAHFAVFRERRAELLANHDEIADILIRGAEQANKRATQTIDDVRRLIGVR